MRRAAVVLALALLFILPAASEQPFPNCTEFGMQISHACCCTNGCGAEAKPGEFVHIGDDQYRSTVTGQVIQRTGWSPDGRFIRCACDFVDDKWQWHPKAFVRCVYPPMPSS